MQIGPYEVSRALETSAAGPARYLARGPQGEDVCVEWRAPAAPPVLAAFLEAARRAAALRHPGLVQTLGGGEQEGRPWLAWAWVGAESLEERLARGALLEPLAACRVLLGLSEALEAAHAVGLVHGYVRPAEVLLLPDGRAQLRGLGLAPLRDPLDPRGAPVEVASYLAPEVAGAEGGTPTPARDVHGLGGVLFAMLTGDAPFDADTTPAVLDEILVSQPPPPSARAPAVPRAVDAICLRCLAAYPARRYPGCAALSQALREALGEAAPPPPRRAPRTLAAALVLAGAAGAAAILASGEPAPVNATPPAPPRPSTPPQTASASPSPLAPTSPSSPTEAPSPAVDVAPLVAGARANAAAGDWEGARAGLEQALTQAPDRGDVWADLAWVQDALGADPRPAIAEATRRLPPDDPERDLLDPLAGAAAGDALLEAFSAEVRVPDADADLAGPALLLAGLDEEAPDPALARDRLDRWAGALRRELAPGADGPGTLRALHAVVGPRLPALEATPTPASLSLDRVLGGEPAAPVLQTLVALEVGRRAGLQVTAWSAPDALLVGDAAGEWLLDPARGALHPRAELPSEPCESLTRAGHLIALLAELGLAYERNHDVRRQLTCLRLLRTLVTEPDAQLGLLADESTLYARLGLHRRAAAVLAEVVAALEARGAGALRVRTQLERSRAQADARWTR